MEYRGRYNIFNPGQIKTYPLRTRTNKVRLGDILQPSDIGGIDIELPVETIRMIETVAEQIVTRRGDNQPVIFFTGAHLIKNGLGPLLADLVRREMVTLVAGNGATAIHDFELALIGETSEYVPQALEKGQFGMAYEFSYINAAVKTGNLYRLGLGEALGKMICEEPFRREVLSDVELDDSPQTFQHPEISVLRTCYESQTPFTIHAGIGTDVIDQHPSFDGQAKGGCSGRDFLIYCHGIAKCDKGAVILNVGSAVTGPEVLLKAISMAANIGKVPRGIITADFDLRIHNPKEMTNESAQEYYFRDQKSVVTRVPQAFGGEGYYIQGDQKKTILLLYQKIIERL